MHLNAVSVRHNGFTEALRCKKLRTLKVMSFVPKQNPYISLSLRLATVLMQTQHLNQACRVMCTGGFL